MIINLSTDGGAIDSSSIISTLEKHTSQLELRRLDEKGQQMEIAFVVSFDSHSALLTAKDALKEKHPNASFSFLELV